MKIRCVIRERTGLAVRSLHISFEYQNAFAAKWQLYRAFNRFFMHSVPLIHADDVVHGAAADGQRLVVCASNHHTDRLVQVLRGDTYM